MRSVDGRADPLGSAFSKILACTDHSAVDSQLLQPIAEHMAATSGVYFRFSAAPRTGCHAASYLHTGGSPEAPEAYLDRFYQLDPVVRSGLDWLHDPRLPFKPVAGLSSSAVEVRDRSYRDAFLHRYDIGHVLALMVPCPIASGPQLMCVGFHRRVDDRPFMSWEVEQFERLAPAISSALRLLAYQDADRLSHDVLDALAAAAGDVGFVILDHDLAIENANARGLADLGVTDAANVTSLLGEVRHSLLYEQVDKSVRQLVSLRDHNGRALEVAVSRLSGAAGRERYLLTTSEPLTARLLASATHAFDLTERESEIARLVAAGLCNADLGAELRISLRTVENHLRSVYAKVGVSSRTQLVSKLLRLQ